MAPGLFRTLLVLGLIYFVVRFVRMVKASSRMTNASNSGGGSSSSKKEGDITIENIPDEYKRANTSKTGDYVDFEEVKKD